MTPASPSVSFEQISGALDQIKETGPQRTDGKWLERMTAECGVLIAEWDVSNSWLWMDWPCRQKNKLLECTGYRH